MITTLNLDESAKLEFGVSITGASGVPQSRFIIEGKDYSIMFPGTQVNENIEVNLPAMKSVLPAGEFNARLEIVLDNKLYIPLQESITFNPLIAIESKVKQAKPVIKESVQVAKVVVKKSELNEALLRQSQAALIVSKSLHYTPKEDETPAEIIEHAVEEAGELTQEQNEILKEMLDLAESVGITVNKNLIKEKQEYPKLEQDDFTDSDIDELISTTDEDDLLDAYDDEEFAIIDHEGSEINESVVELNEILSRSERIKARLRMARTKTKREVKLQYALKKHSSGTVLNHRARRMAVIVLKRKLAKKPISELSINDKERIERIIAKKSKLLDRIAMKMIPVVRNLEKNVYHINLSRKNEMSKITEKILSLIESIDLSELNTSTLDSYAEKARTDSNALAKSANRAKNYERKTSLYAAAAKRALNANKAERKSEISKTLSSWKPKSEIVSADEKVGKDGRLHPVQRKTIE